ncbi:MAG: gamma-glutamyltransferase [Armatimonadetes bacterium]|nr:gamma-glutamyltransferase [Armatimonadota bacterium]
MSSEVELELPDPPFPVWGEEGIAACDHPEAARAGCQVLQEGGNAVDAAVTISLTLGVLCPYYTGIAGGGFMMIWLPGFDRPRVLDYREVAPGAAYPEMFEGRPRASTRGALAVGVPGSVAGLAEVLQTYGTISWERALAPGIELAEQGFPVYPNFRRVTMARRKMLGLYPEACRIFLGEHGEGFKPGQRLRQPELAETYRRLAAHGPRELYEGLTAERIVSELQADGGILTLEDLAGYRAVWREPLSAVYRGKEVFAVGPPSGGGVQLLQCLQMLEPFSFTPARVGTAQTYHLQAEAMRLSFADRSSWVADPAFFDVPVHPMLDPARLAELHLLIDPKKAMELVEVPPLEGYVPSAMGQSRPGTGGTSSFAVAHKGGGFVVATESINLWFGSMMIPRGTGVLLNDILDDFSRTPGTPDAFGLVSSRINQVEPRKRPASSSCPMIMAEQGKPIMAAGSAGGPRIATSVLQVVMNVVDHRLNIRQAMDAPRVHHQWLPDELVVEKFIPEDIRKNLRSMGHRVVEGPNRSHGCSVGWSGDDELFYGAGDFRSGGDAAGV